MSFGQVAFVLVLLSPALRQDEAPAARGMTGQATQTRSASQYQALEVQILTALRDGHGTDLDRLLAPDFEVWSAERSGATPRQAWQLEARPQRLPQIRELTVREFGDVAVVSFLMQDGLSGGVARTTYVVDIWSQSTHRLNVRYVSIPAHPAPNQPRRE